MVMLLYVVTVNLYMKYETNHSFLQYVEVRFGPIHRTVSPECEHLPYGVLAQNVLPCMLELCVKMTFTYTHIQVGNTHANNH